MVGIFPDQPSVIRLVGSVLMDIADELQVTRRHFSQKSIQKLTDPEPVLVSEPAPFRLALVRWGDIS